jgi:hypothetical protein
MKALRGWPAIDALRLLTVGLGVLSARRTRLEPGSRRGRRADEAIDVLCLLRAGAQHRCWRTKGALSCAQRYLRPCRSG